MWLLLIFFPDSTWPTKLWFGLLPYFFLFLLMLLWRHSFKLPQIKCVILRLRVSQFLGKISMALYLIHWPVALYFQHYLGHFIGATETMLYICGVSFVLSGGGSFKKRVKSKQIKFSLIQENHMILWFNNQLNKRVNSKL